MPHRHSHKALAEIGNWEALCANLGVEEAVLDGLRYAQLYSMTERNSVACSHFTNKELLAGRRLYINVLTEYPFYKRRLANWIAKEYSVEQPDEERPEKCKLFLPCLYLSAGLSIYLPICLYVSIYLPIY